MRVVASEFRWNALVFRELKLDSIPACGFIAEPLKRPLVLVWIAAIVLLEARQAQLRQLSREVFQRLMFVERAECAARLKPEQHYMSRRHQCLSRRPPGDAPLGREFPGRRDNRKAINCAFDLSRNRPEV